MELSACSENWRDNGSAEGHGNRPVPSDGTLQVIREHWPR